MDIHAKLHFNWEINKGRGKTAIVEKFEEVWTITKTNDDDKLHIVSPNDDVFELHKNDFKVANIIFHKYDMICTFNSTVSLFIENKKVFTYDVYQLLDQDAQIPKDFGMVFTLIYCYKGKLLSR